LTLIAEGQIATHQKEEVMARETGKTKNKGQREKRLVVKK